MTLKEKIEAARKAAKGKTRDVEAAYKNKGLKESPAPIKEAPKTMGQIDSGLTQHKVEPKPVQPAPTQPNQPVEQKKPKKTRAELEAATDEEFTDENNHGYISEQVDKPVQDTNPDWSIQGKLNNIAKANPYLSTEQIINIVKDDVGYNPKDDEVYNKFSSYYTKKEGPAIDKVLTMDEMIEISKRFEEQQKKEEQQKQEKKRIEEEKKSADSIYSQLVNGEPVSSELKDTPAYKQANKRFTEFNKYNSMNASQLSYAISGGDLLPGTDVYNDLSKTSPEKIREAENAALIQKMLGKEKLGTEDIFTILTKRILGDLTGDEQDFKSVVSQSPEVIRLTKEAEEEKDRVDELKQQIDYAEDDLLKELEGTGATTAYKNALLNQRLKGYYRQYDSAVSKYNNTLGSLERVTDNIKYEYEQNEVNETKALQGLEALYSASLKEQEYQNSLSSETTGGGGTTSSGESNPRLAGIIRTATETFGKRVSDDEREAIELLFEQYPEASADEIIQQVKGYDFDNEEQKEIGEKLLSKMRGVTPLSELDLPGVAYFIKQGDYAGAIKKAERDAITGNEATSNRGFNDIARVYNVINATNHIKDMMDKLSPGSFGLWDGTIENLESVIKNNEDYTKIKADIENFFGPERTARFGVNLTENEEKFVKSFMPDTKNPEGNLKSKLNSLKDAVLREYNSVRQSARLEPLTEEEILNEDKLVENYMLKYSDIVNISESDI